MLFINIIIILLMCCHGNVQGNHGEVDEVEQLIEEFLDRRASPKAATPPGGALSRLYGPPLKIGAFNIRMFGKTKAAKQQVMDSLVQILLRYDIVLVQEIRDVTGEAIIDFLAQLNSATEEGNYEMSLSERLGRSSSKEQYAFLYRSDKVKVMEDLQYADSRDWFERPPYVVRFLSESTELGDFAIVGCHIKPDDAAQEMDHLVDVYEDVVNKWTVKDVIMLGDFNADCGYMSASAWENVRLRHDSRFTWLTSDDLDSTVAQASCAYDRIVVAGPSIANSVVPGSVDVYRYDTALRLSYEDALEVSDHYPVEFDMVGKVDKDVSEHIQIQTSFSVDSTQTFSEEELHDVVGNTGSLGFDTAFVENGVILTKHGVKNVQGLLQSLLDEYPLLMTSEVIELVRLYMRKGILEGIPTIPGSANDVTSGYDVTIMYDIDGGKFTVTVAKPLF